MKPRRSHPFTHSPGRGRLSRTRERLIYAVVGGLWASGVGWLVFRYFLRPVGEFGELPHPLEAWWLRLHGLGAFVFLWLLGVLWVTHLVPAWRAQRRWSGIVLASITTLLVATGYFLYYASEGFRDVVGLMHWIVGIALPLPLLWHSIRGRAKRRT